MKNSVKIVECPRDAMQGITNFISTDLKVLYINQLLKVGFDTIDFGSFVSPRAIPQLKDTAEVLERLDLENTRSKLLAIIANVRGGFDACKFDEINYLGFPLSVSEQFQQRNTNKSINEALHTVELIKNMTVKKKKELVVYLSMAFGNPYDEAYHPDIVAELTAKLNQLEVKIISLSDTIGASKPQNIAPLFHTLINEYPEIEFGAHFHTALDNWKEKVSSAYINGCKRFDSTLKGLGGCPMANEELVGNLPTENLMTYFDDQIDLNYQEFNKSLEMAANIF